MEEAAGAAAEAIRLTTILPAVTLPVVTLPVVTLPAAATARVVITTGGAITPLATRMAKATNNTADREEITGEMTEQPPPPAADGGWLHTIIHFLKGLTLTNTIVIVILIVALIPAYFVWRLLNDEVMLYRFLSSYREVPNPVAGSNCVLREVSMRGGGDQFAIATNFATLGNDRWQIGVILGHRPTDIEIQTYCETLGHIIDKMRDPTKPAPAGPGSDEPLIWPWPESEAEQ